MTVQMFFLPVICGCNFLFFPLGAPKPDAVFFSQPFLFISFFLLAGEAQIDRIAHSSNQTALGNGSLDEGGKQGMWLKGARFEFGMKLHPDKPGVVGTLDNLGQFPIRGYP